MSEKAEVVIELVHGVEGDCLVINNRRVAGPKPWGGGKVIKKWLVRLADIHEALKGGAL